MAITTTDIEHIFNELTCISELNYINSISINKTTTISLINNNIFIIFLDNDDKTIIYNRNDKKIEIFNNIIDVYDIKNTYFYKKNYIHDVKVYTPEEVFILNKHVIKIKPHPRFNLKKTNMINFAKLNNYDYYFVFDIEDKRETSLHILYEIFNPYLPPEMVDHIVSFIDKKNFPFEFVPRYNLKMPKYFIKEQLIQLYEMRVIKIALKSSDDNINILTNEAYDYIFPYNKPNRIKTFYNSKENMNNIIDELLENLKKN